MSIGPVNISVRTIAISYDYLRYRVITISLHWINSDIKQIYPIRFASKRKKSAMLRFIVIYGNHKWFIGNRKWPRYVYSNYLNQIFVLDQWKNAYWVNLNNKTTSYLCELRVGLFKKDIANWHRVNWDLYVEFINIAFSYTYTVIYLLVFKNELLCIFLYNYTTL